MKNKEVATNAKLADGSTVAVNSSIRVPETIEELKELASQALGTKDPSAIESHLVDLFVSWNVAHTYQSQVRAKLRRASPNLTYDQLSDLVDEVQFRVPRPASALHGDKVTIKRSQLNAEQISKLKEMGIL